MKSKQPKHTPTPWVSFNHYISNKDIGDIASCRIVQEGNPITVEESYANAKFIVKAVNSHDKLVRTLCSVLGYFEEIENYYILSEDEQMYVDDIKNALKNA